MGKRRWLAQYTSDDDDDDDDDDGNAAPEAPEPAAPGSSRRRHSAADDQADLELVEEGEDGNVPEEMRRKGEKERRKETQTSRQGGRKPEESGGELEEKAEAGEVAEEDPLEAVPLGEPVEITGEEKLYAAYEYDGNTYKLVSRHPATFLFLCA